MACHGLRIEGDNRDATIQEAGKKLHDVREIIRAMALELQNEKPQRFSRAISPGKQQHLGRRWCHARTQSRQLYAAIA